MKFLKLVAASLLILTVMAYISSCGKKDDPSPAQSSSGDYLPVTKDNEWSYTGDIVYSVKMTGNTKVFGTKTYYEGLTTSDNGVTAGYVAKENGVYYDRGNLVPGDTIELIMLKDNVPVGTSWSSSVDIDSLGLELTLQYVFTIDQKGISHTVGSKSFDNVISVKMVSNLTFPGVGSVPFATEYLYFAKDVGLIQTHVDTGTSTLDANLTSYTLH